MEESKILIKLNDHDHEIGSIKHRVKEIEDKQETINTLASSVNELAINMRYMVEEQKEQGERLKKLETEPVESIKYYKRLIIGTTITTILGLVIGAIIGIFL